MTARIAPLYRRLGLALAAVFALTALTAAPAQADDATGAISGTVTRADGTAATDVWIRLARDGSNVPGTTGFVYSDGTYRIDGLAPGEYQVTFELVDGGNPFDEHPLVTQYWDGVYGFPSATSVPVTAGATTGGIDAVMRQGARLTGTVSIAGSGAPVNGADLDLYRERADGSFEKLFYPADTFGDGAFEFGNFVAPGTYTVYTTTSGSGAISGWYGGGTSAETAGTFVVEEAVDRSVSIVLQPTDPLAALPCVNPRDRAAVADLVRQFSRLGVGVGSLTRADLLGYLARCR